MLYLVPPKGPMISSWNVHPYIPTENRGSYRKCVSFNPKTWYGRSDKISTVSVDKNGLWSLQDTDRHGSKYFDYFCADILSFIFRAHRRMFTEHFRSRAVSKFQMREFRVLQKHLLDTPENFMDHIGQCVISLLTERIAFSPH